MCNKKCMAIRDVGSYNFKKCKGGKLESVTERLFFVGTVKFADNPSCRVALLKTGQFLDFFKTFTYRPKEILSCISNQSQSIQSCTRVKFHGSMQRSLKNPVISPIFTKKTYVLCISVLEFSRNVCVKHFRCGFLPTAYAIFDSALISYHNPTPIPQHNRVYL